MDDAKGQDIPHEQAQPATEFKAAQYVWRKRVAIAICVVSALAIVQVFSSPWTYKKPEASITPADKPREEIREDTLLSLAKQQRRLIVGKIHLNATGWHSSKKQLVRFMKPTEFVRGWTVPCSIDVYIDMGKLKDDSLDLFTSEDGSKSLTITLPTPEIDMRQAAAIQPDKLKLVLEHGELESGDFMVFRREAFAQMKEKIRETLDQNADAIMEMSKSSAESHFASFYAALGIPKVTVQWVAELSVPKVEIPSSEGELPL